MRTVTVTAALALLSLVVNGCNRQTQDPEALALRGQYVLATEPAGAMTLSELAQRLEHNAEDSADAVAQDAEVEPVVVIGRIFAGDLEPWESGKASFLLAELPEQGHGEGHDADNCPFCKRKAANAPTAIIQFLDDTGQVIAHDARKLFGVQKNDVVTIHGQATRGQLNTLIVTADAIHVRGK